ncbi:uncharacterized protein LOC133647764 [Entelurus aequoreus]|uniref:uncharacterized protein LOC133647764 n=1 Tax=Entelurus aequoreus TaxID=161455 RepID=UPI002B1D3040|nr:uncharacterized protein LOC133647764 [Entelurus aequoreus]
MHDFSALFEYNKKLLPARRSPVSCILGSQPPHPCGFLTEACQLGKITSVNTQRRVTFHLPNGSQESCSDSGLGDPEPSSTASTSQGLPLSFPQEEYYEQTSPNSRTEGDGNSDPESSLPGPTEAASVVIKSGTTASVPLIPRWLNSAGHQRGSRCCLQACPPLPPPGRRLVSASLQVRKGAWRREQRGPRSHRSHATGQHEGEPAMAQICSF